MSLAGDVTYDLMMGQKGPGVGWGGRKRTKNLRNLRRLSWRLLFSEGSWSGNHRGTRTWGLDHLEAQKDRKISEGDQEVLEPRKQGIQGVKREFLGGGKTHQITQSAVGIKFRRRSSVAFKRNFWKAVEMDAE